MKTAVPPRAAPGPRWVAAALTALVLTLYGADLLRDILPRDGFTWMDPQQYFDFARDVLTGARAWNAFEVPSLFPFLLMPLLALFGPHAAAGLAVSLPLAVVMAVALHRLRARLDLPLPGWLLTLLALTAPLTVGLSRSLYSEFALAVLVAVHYAVWFASNNFRDRRATAWFAALFGLGIMLKMTYPLFVIGPLTFAALMLVRERRLGDLARLAAALALAGSAVLLIQYLFFPVSFGYYMALGNSTIRATWLIGPPVWHSLDSLLYYPWHWFRSVLWLWAPLLALAGVVALARRARPDHDTVVLLLWLVVPGLLLTLQPVKEPRHIAPCVVPALLLLARAITLLPVRLRRHAPAGLVVVALAQYLALTSHTLYAPYFFDRPHGATALETALRQALPADIDAPSHARTADLLWRYQRNLALTGFSPNHALALVWAFHPAITMDLDLLDTPAHRQLDTALETVEDPYLIAAFNSYNHRCNRPYLYRTLTRDAILEHAEAILVCDDDGTAAERFPGHREHATLEIGPHRVAIWLPDPSRETVPYRTLYMRTVLRRNPDMPEADRNAVHFELVMNAALHQQPRLLLDSAPLFPEGWQPGTARRNLYWLGAYPPLVRLTEQRLGPM